MTHIFISHSSENDAFVTQLAADLRAAGLQTWVDHENIKPSEDWDESVEEALEATSTMVVVLTPRATRSQNVKVEWSFFLDLGKPIYPIQLEMCKVPFRLRLHQHVDFTKDQDQALQKLLTALGAGPRTRRAPPRRRSRKRAPAQPAPIRVGNIRRVDTSVVLSGHRDSVKGVAISPDGAVLASASDDKNVRLWNTVRHTRIKVMIGHEGPVQALAFSPDGAILASASGDRTIRLWDVAKRYGITALAGHSGGVNAVVYSPDGTRIASASDDGTVRLWNAAKRSKSGVLEGHDGPVNDAVFSPDGAILASAGMDGAVRAWDVAGAREIAAVEAGTEARRLAFSPDGSLLAVGLNGGGVIAFDTTTWAKVGAIYYADYNARCVRGVTFSPDGTLIAIASLDGNIRLWKTADLLQPDQKRAMRVLRGHDGGLCAVTFSPDGQMLASGSHDATVRLWRVVE